MVSDRCGCGQFTAGGFLLQGATPGRDDLLAYGVLHRVGGECVKQSTGARLLRWMRALWIPPRPSGWSEAMWRVYLANYRFMVAMAIGFILFVPAGLVLLALAFLKAVR